jgi:hypothetical protein
MEEGGGRHEAKVYYVCGRRGQRENYGPVAVAQARPAKIPVEKRYLRSTDLNEGDEKGPAAGFGAFAWAHSSICTKCT